MAIVKQTEEKNKNMQVSVTNEHVDEKVTYTAFLSELFIISFLYLSIILTLVHFLKFEHVSIYLLLIGVLIIGLQLYIKNRWHQSYVIYGIFTLQLISIILFQKYMINGLFLTFNQFFEVLGRHTSIFIDAYDIAINPSLHFIAINVFWVHLSILFALFITFLVQKRWSLIIFFIVISLYVFQMMTGILPNRYDNALLFIVMIISLHHFFISRSSRNESLSKSHSELTFIVMMIVIVMTLLTGLLTSSTQFIENIGKPDFVSNIKESVTNTYDNIRYGKGDIDSLPEGDLAKLGRLQLIEEEALEVVMTEPESYYLRGFVGAQYSGSEWLELDYTHMYDSYNLFYWLEREEFIPLQQLSIVNELGSPNEEYPKNDIVINNIGASSKYIFLPYELNSNVASQDEFNYFQEYHMLSDKFSGHRNYSYSASYNLVKYYPRITNRLYESRDDEDVTQYSELESHYNQFVYEHYTELTEDATSFFDSYIDQTVFAGEKRVTYEDAIELVGEYLEHILSYEEEVEQVPSNKDFVTYVVEDIQAGYAPHYATVATTMFRYLGIPSRYVEGYLITPEMVKDQEQYARISVTGEEAHAWTEIYIDEVGWIPLEFTPAYTDVMEPTDMSEYPKGKWSNDEASQSIKDEEETEEDVEDDANVSSIEEDEEEQEQLNEEDNSGDNDDEGNLDENDDGGSGTSGGGSITEDPEDEQSTLWKVILLILLIVILLLLLIYLIYLIKKRLELRKLKQSFYDENINNAIIKLFSYTLLLFQYDGIKERKGSTHKYVKDIRQKYGNEYGNEFKEIINLAQVAAYSDRELLTEEHERVLAYNKAVLNQVKQSRNIFQKVKMRLWDFIY